MALELRWSDEEDALVTNESELDYLNREYERIGIRRPVQPSNGKKEKVQTKIPFENDRYEQNPKHNERSDQDESDELEGVDFEESTRKRWVPIISSIAFLLLCLSVLRFLPKARSIEQYIPVESLTQVNERFQSFQSSLGELSRRQDKVSSSNQQLAELVNRINKNFNERWEVVVKSFEKINSSNSERISENRHLKESYQRITDAIKFLEDKIAKVNKYKGVDIDRFLDEIYAKIDRIDLSLEENSIDKVEQMVRDAVAANRKSDVDFEFLVENLVGREVNRRMQDFSSDLDFRKFLKDNEYELVKYIQENSIEALAKDQVDKMIDTAVRSYNLEFKNELNTLKSSFSHRLDDLKDKLVKAYTGRDSLIDSTSDVVIKEMISRAVSEKLEQSRFNYGNFKTGARILGHLTSPNRRKHRKFVSRVMFGWLDFVSRHFSNEEYDSNSPVNAILPDETMWQSFSNTTQLAIRLSDAIYIDQITLQYPRFDNTLACAPRKVSILVKPKERHLTKQLKAEFDTFNQEFKSYLKEYTKIAEYTYELEGPALQTLKVPQLNALIRNVVVLVESNWGDPDKNCLSCVMVYGSKQKDEELGDDELVG